MNRRPQPVQGAFARREGETGRIAEVLGPSIENGRLGVLLRYPDRAEFVPLEEVRSGLMPGQRVVDVPLTAGRPSLGAGLVAAVRRLGDCDQALVQFERDGRSLWLPYEGLRRIKAAEMRFLQAHPEAPGAAERLALRLMAEALRTWNDATGALDRLDVDPLPHQMHLVHRIMQSNTADWVIADDVGLGKTIELGLLLSAMEARWRTRRVLVVTPAGLTRQWQDEMRVKFERDFSIYQRDFHINEPWQWSRYDRVIASLDLLKPQTSDAEGDAFDSHFGRLLAAPDWDLVVFDEAHRLSRNDRGDRTLRYRLAAKLRERTRHMTLLTGTPHQGDAGKFRSLLQLTRPEMSEALSLLEMQPEIAAQIVLRNRKIDVTDANGDFIFKGQDIRTVPIDAGPEMVALERNLRAYLAQGYHAAEQTAGTRGRAIGFVMTTYRKLASSSVAALEAALTRRADRLDGLFAASVHSTAPFDDEDDEGDDLLAERSDGLDARAFFEGERERLQDVLRNCRAARPHDGKLAAFRQFISEVVVTRGAKVVVFTEYRATQNYLVEAVAEVTGTRPAVINGSQSLDEKLAAVAAFNGETPVLVSTEAGGEGLNLHRRCHTLINYDLPWNPSRLVQRIGRIYRYGQQQRVVVVNMAARDSIDSDVLAYTLQRIQTIAAQMRSVSAEYDDRYEAEIVGELLDQIDLGEVLDKAMTASVERSRERVDEALRRAENARELQSQLLDQLDRFDPNALRRLGSFTTAHLASFVRRAAHHCGATIEDVSTDGESFTLRLDDALRGQFVEFGRRTVIACTTRRQPQRDSGVIVLDFKNSFLAHMIERVRSPDFGATHAVVSNIDFGGQVLGAFTVRWQDAGGEPTGEDLHVAVRTAAGSVEVDNSALQPFFAATAADGSPRDWSRAERAHTLQAMRDRVELIVADEASVLKHPNDLLLFGAAEAALNG